MCVCVCLRVFVCVCVCVCVCVYVHTHIHTYIYMYMYVYRLAFTASLIFFRSLALFLERFRLIEYSQIPMKGGRKREISNESARGLSLREAKV